jgi:hypothetical protein
MALSVIYPPVAGAQRMRNQMPTQQAIMVDGTWRAWMKQADVLQTAAPGGGISPQLTVRGEILGAPLMSLVVAMLGGKPVSSEVQLETFDLNRGTGVSAWKLSGARIQEVTLPAADASNTGVGSFAVKFSQDAADQVAPPAATLPSIATAPVIRQNMFRLDIDSIGGSYVMAVAPVVVTPAPVEKGAGLPPLVVTVRSGLPVQAQEQFAGWQQWFASGQPRGGTLTFLAADLRTPVLVERFSGLRVTSISSAAAASTVTLAMTGMSIESYAK